MNSVNFIQQLEKKYVGFLKNRICENQFEQIILRGGKNKPDNSIDLHNAIKMFLQFEKTEDKKGWDIEWEQWISKKIGKQRWPNNVIVNTAEDFLFLIQKEKEILIFDQILADLKRWRQGITGWLVKDPEVLIKHIDNWAGLCAVVDYLLSNDATTYYIRNLPVPVHTKFIEENERIILSLLQHFNSEKDNIDYTSLNHAVGLKRKPVLFPIRWLDEELAVQNTQGMVVLGATPENLRNRNWEITELWMVENETALFMLPERKHSLAICSRGKALELLSDIAWFNNVKLYYWGDMDEDGYAMLRQCRKLYPHTKSVLMDIDALLFHSAEIHKQPTKYRYLNLSELTFTEGNALERLFEINGRLEQESLSHEYIIKAISHEDTLSH
ncbi:Wadjet anti-phage system protein JetD domain-containing protein [Ferruginibacter profundus]|nr:hypothetical protein [Bacteroidota bacterium]